MMQFHSKAMGFGPSIVTQSPLLSGEVSFAYSVALTGISGTAPYTWSLSSGAFPTGLSINAAGVISGTPTAAQSTNPTIKLTDSAGGTVLKTFSVTTVTAVNITTASLPAGTVGTAYSTTLAAAGGVSPYLWGLVAGSIDPGLTLNATSGLISGVPLTATTYSPTFQVTDALGYSVQKALSLVINAQPQVATPTFSPIAGTYVGSQSVTISCSTPSSTIYYTTDGSTPTTGSPVYSSPVAVVSSETLQAIATAAGYSQSNVGSAAYVINAPTGITNAGPFTPGDYVISSNYSRSQAQVQSDITTYVKGFPAIKGYVCQYQAHQLVSGSSYDNSVTNAQTAAGNYAGFASILTDYTYAMSQGIHWGGIFINWVGGGSAFPSGSVSGRTVPDYILNAPGGSITLPTTFGGSTTNVYTMAQQSNGQYGFGMENWNGVSTYSNITPAIWEPAVLQMQILFMQALAVFLQAQGIVCEIIGTGDELSSNWGGPGQNYTVPGANATLANVHANYIAHWSGVSAAFPQSFVVPCLSFGASINGSADTNANMYSVYIAGLAPLGNVALCGADHLSTAWTLSQLNYYYASNAQQAFIGATAPNRAPYATQPSFSGTNRTGAMPSFAQIEPLDFAWKGSGTTYNQYYIQTGQTAGTAAFVESIAQQWYAGSNTRTTHRLWWPIDEFFNSSSWNAASGAPPNNTAGYLYPGISAAATTYPCSTLLVTGKMVAPQGLNAVATGTTTATVSWIPQAAGTTGVGLTYGLYRNSVLLTTLPITQSSYSDGGMSPDTAYTYQICVQNGNGIGPLSAPYSFRTPVFDYQTFTGSTPVSSIVNGGTGNGIANGVAYIAQGNAGHQGGCLWNLAQVNVQAFTMNATFTMPTWDGCTITAGSPNITISSANNGIIAGLAIRFGGNFGSLTGIDSNTLYSITSVSTAGPTTTFSVGVTPGGTGTATVTAILMFGLSFSVQNSNLTTQPGQSPYYGTGFTGDANLSGIGGYATSAGVQFPLGNSVNVNFMAGNGGPSLNSTAYGPGQSANTAGLFINGGPFNNLAMRSDLNPFGMDLNTGNPMSITAVYDGTNMDVTLVNTVTNAQARLIWPLANLTSVVGGNNALVGFNCGMLPKAQSWVSTWVYTASAGTRLAAPTFSVTPGQYTSTQTVALTAAPGASIYYTTNGLVPTSASTLYTAPITVSATKNLQAVAVQTGYTSSYPSGGVFQIATGGTPKVNFPSGFATLGGQLILNGYPHTSGSNIQLAGAGNYFFNGAVWTSTPQTISTFTSNFTFTSAAAGDAGFTFSLQNYNQSATTYNTPQDGGWVSGGPLAMLDSNVVGSLGYAAQLTSYAPHTQIVGLGTSVCVAFDMSVGAKGAVGIYSGGAIPSGSSTSLTNLSLFSSNPINVAVSYNGTTLSVMLTDTVTLGTQTISATVNIASLVGSTAYAGFTAATGYDSNANIQLTKWTM